MIELIKKVDDLWKDDYDSLITSAEEIIRKLQESHLGGLGENMDQQILDEAFEQLKSMFDENHGGFGSAPKFPAPHNMLFLLGSMKENGRLMHRYRKGEWEYYANIDDYAFLIYGLIELYEATFDTRYLKRALSLNEELIQLFWDKINGGFYFTPEDGEKMLFRTKEVYDGAIPSGNSIELLNLIRLARISGNSKLEKYADKLQKAFSKTVMELLLDIHKCL